MLILREQVYDAIQCLGGVVGMHGAEHQVACSGHVEGRLHRFPVPNLTDLDDVADLVAVVDPGEIVEAGDGDLIGGAVVGDVVGAVDVEETVAATVWVWVAFGEQPALTTVLGGVIVISSVMLATIRR